MNPNLATWTLTVLTWGLIAAALLAGGAA